MRYRSQAASSSRSFAALIPISAARSCGIGFSRLIQFQVSAIVSGNGLHVSPARAARREVTAQVPGAGRHNGISVHGSTSCPESQWSSTQTSLARRPVTSRQVSINSP